MGRHGRVHWMMGRRWSAKCVSIMQRTYRLVRQYQDGILRRYPFDMRIHGSLDGFRDWHRADKLR